jgi:hypothetical protein
LISEILNFLIFVALFEKVKEWLSDLSFRLKIRDNIKRYRVKPTRPKVKRHKIKKKRDEMKREKPDLTGWIDKASGKDLLEKMDDKLKDIGIDKNKIRWEAEEPYLDNIKVELQESYNNSPSEEDLEVFEAIAGEEAERQRAKELEERRRIETKKRETGGYIYFLYCVEHKVMKIGFTEKPYMRLKTLLSNAPFLTFMYLNIIEGTLFDEERLHTKFDHLRIENNQNFYGSRTEWFKATKELYHHIKGLKTIKPTDTFKGEILAYCKAVNEVALKLLRERNAVKSK